MIMKKEYITPALAIEQTCPTQLYCTSPGDGIPMKDTEDDDPGYAKRRSDWDEED